MRRDLPLGLAASDHAVPYGTVLWSGAVPGTSCQATIGRKGGASIGTVARRLGKGSRLI